MYQQFSVMDLADVKNYEDLIRAEVELEDGEELLQLLRENGLVKRRGRRCCNRPMREAPYGKSRLFGKAWRCSVCYKTKQIMVGSFFENSKLHPLTILKVAYSYLVVGLSHKAMSVMMRNTPVKNNLTDWMQFCRDVLSKDLIRELENEKLGGPGKIVVVDETALAKRKYQRGRMKARETIWVLGMYDVEKKVGLLVWIPNRSHEGIIPKIEENVEPGTKIITDELRTYRCLAARGYQHRTVNHSREFVGADGTHTNHIEAYFSRMKRFMKRRDVRVPSSIPGYIDEFLWMERHQTDIWPSFLRAVKRQYRC